ncbi:hypothetical protein B0J11DRAFT_535076 [Dendryphion nanum]|uniref:Capsule polysaccharide biosynthesis protein n=1 Tax=Dendryphion nanum TaxID=256645 RepID=A0A9P9DJC8_9PLEO|nr:hypothetical protein B0J11DRAFT_535076 [Dendryphion nanum]
MASQKIAIPKEFQRELRYVELLDKRTDNEILDELTTHVTITSEKNVWTYWHAGVRAMPSWCQRNVVNWVRLLGPSWTVRVLDAVPGSPNHALNFIDASQLPETFVKGTMEGPYTGPHSADFLRCAALYKYGGAWMDVGILLFRHLDKICWDKLEDESNDYSICVPWMFAQHIANHFVCARKGDQFIGKWHSLFMHFWQNQSDHTGIIQSPLIAFVHKFKFEESEKRGYHWDFKVDELTVLGYIGQVIAFIRLAWLQEPNEGFNGVEYYQKKILLYDSLAEDWAAEPIVGFAGEGLFKVLSTSRNADPESDEYKLAYRTVWRLLTKSGMQKVTHGKHLMKTPALGVFLDKPENQELDLKEGTFFELLRYGSVHFEQTRESSEYVEPKLPDEDQIIKKGIFEA